MNACLRSDSVEAVAGFDEHGAAHRAKAALQHLFFLRPDGGELDFALALERIRRERRVPQHIADQTQSGSEVAAQHFGAQPEAVIAAEAVNAAAQGFDNRGDLIGGPLLGSLQQHFRHQLREAVGRGRFREHAALEHGAELDERQAMVLFEEQAQSVRQFKFLDGAIAALNLQRDLFWRGAGREQRIERPVLCREIFSSHALKVAGFDPLHRVQITLGEIEIIGRNPVAAQVLRLALHGFARAQRRRYKLFDGLVEFGRVERF